MKPVDFDYERPSTVVEAVRLLAGRNGAETKILAGGQSLIPLLVNRTVRPKLIVDIGRIAELNYIRPAGDGIRVGATVRQADCASSALVRLECPILAEAIDWVATPQVRNQGTVVGSLAQRNAISEIPTVAVAIGARLTVVDDAGRRREVGAADFLDPKSPGTLGTNELVVEANFPRLGSGLAWCFHEVQRRSAHYALVGAAVTFRLGRAGEILDSRVAVSGLAASPVRLETVESALNGRAPSPEAFADAAERSGDDPLVDPLDDLHATAEYRRQVAPVVIRRALARARARLGDHRPLFAP
jgi:CO/xanthine dehydrogenase FAD-binding subunit